MLGDENYAARRNPAVRNIGVTDFNAAIMDVEDGAYDRTLEFLASIKG